MKNKEIFSELGCITNIKDKDSNIYVAKWKLKYLDKYLDFGNVNEIDEYINVEPGKDIKLDGFLGKFSLSEQGKYFISNYDNSKSAKLDSYLGKYPNITKLFYFLAGIGVGIIPTAVYFLIK